MLKKFNINTELARQISDTNSLSTSTSPKSTLSQITSPFAQSVSTTEKNINTNSSLLSETTKSILSERVYDNVRSKSVTIDDVRHIISNNNGNIKPQMLRQRSKSLTFDHITCKRVKRVSYDELPIPLRKSIKTKLQINDKTKIDDVLKYIFTNKLNYDYVDITEWSNIFKHNLILDYGILCKQSPDYIDKLYQFQE